MSRTLTKVTASPSLTCELQHCTRRPDLPALLTPPVLQPQQQQQPQAAQPQKMVPQPHRVLDTRDFFADLGDVGGSNRYTIKEVVGKGSYGVVCSALDNYTGEKVAIKKVGRCVGWWLLHMHAPHSPSPSPPPSTHICICTCAQSMPHHHHHLTHTHTHTHTRTCTNMPPSSQAPPPHTIALDVAPLPTTP